MTETTQMYDVSTQCEVINQPTKDSTTQCGTLIQLRSVDEEMHTSDPSQPPSPVGTEILQDSPVCSRHTWQKSLSDDETCRSSPSTDILLKGDQSKTTYGKHQHVGLMKHSKSEANMRFILNNANNIISHTRSRSDEAKRKSLPNSPENKRNPAVVPEFTGMHALQTLTESLESSIQRRFNSIGAKISPPSEVDTKMNSTCKDVLVRCNSSSSTSLRKLALMNANSPNIIRKESDRLDAGVGDCDKDEVGEDDELDTFNEDFINCGPSSPAVHTRMTASGGKQAGNKRYTWHDFDSMAELKRIEVAKYGADENKSLTLPLDKNLSKSSEVISTSKKSSLKRSIIRRFTHVLNRSDESTSSLGNNITDKKNQKKEKKRLKKEKRVKEKEDRKRDPSTGVKLRSSSVSSGNSRFSLPPLSSSNSFGSHASSSTSSGNTGNR